MYNAESRLIALEKTFARQMGIITAQEKEARMRQEGPTLATGAGVVGAGKVCYDGSHGNAMSLASVR